MSLYICARSVDNKYTGQKRKYHHVTYYIRKVKVTFREVITCALLTVFVYYS
jgi:hypothetical protein